MTINVSGASIAAIPSSALKTQTVDGGNIIKTLSFIGVDLTGAGTTYSVVAPCLITRITLTNLTASDTFFSLDCDGAMKIRKLDVAYSSTSATLLDIDTGVSAGAAIECKTGFDLFVRTVADTSINVFISYVELS